MLVKLMVTAPLSVLKFCQVVSLFFQSKVSAVFHSMLSLLQVGLRMSCSGEACTPAISRLLLADVDGSCVADQPAEMMRLIPSGEAAWHCLQGLKNVLSTL